MAIMAGVGALGGICSLFGGFAPGSGQAIATTQRIWTASCDTAGTDHMRVAGVTTTINTGDTLATRLALGGYADLALMVGTETYFLGVYQGSAQGDLLDHPRFPDLEAWAAAS